MGWNDHVEFVPMVCLKCGQEDVWEIWSDVAIARYGGGLDKKLGHDVKNHMRCPHCGSKKGKEVGEDEDWEDHDD